MYVYVSVCLFVRIPMHAIAHVQMSEDVLKEQALFLHHVVSTDSNFGLQAL